MFLGYRGTPGALSPSAESYHGGAFETSIAGHGEHRGLFVFVGGEDMEFVGTWWALVPPLVAIVLKKKKK